MRHPNTMIACDSGLRTFGEGVPHPRGYGNNARVPGRYLRDLKVLRLEDAIRKNDKPAGEYVSVQTTRRVTRMLPGGRRGFDPEKVS